MTESIRSVGLKYTILKLKVNDQKDSSDRILSVMIVYFTKTLNLSFRDHILRGGNAEKMTFYWVIVPPKYGCGVVQWAEGFNKKYSKFNFGN